VDFLLECIGFPPDYDLADLARKARSDGEPVPWRGPSGEHYRLALGGGLDLRFDREQGSRNWTLCPYYQTEQRLRVRVETVREVPDSPYDALVTGWGNPPLAGDPGDSPEAYPISIVLTDRRRLPRALRPGHVLAVSVAGFALDVDNIAPETGGQRSARSRPLPQGGWIAPLGGMDDPGGCVELSLPVIETRQRTNPVTGAAVTRIEAAAPGRNFHLFASPWQLATDELPPPAPGSIVEGTFLLTGRIAGGLPSPVERLGKVFG